MTVTHPLLLGDSQLRLVLDHARQIPVLWRSCRLSLVADHLDVISDEDVRIAIKLVGEKIGVAA